MGRSRTIRTKIIGLLLVPLASMVVLWGVITAVTAGESLELRQYTTPGLTCVIPLTSSATSCSANASPR